MSRPLVTFTSLGLVLGFRMLRITNNELSGKQRRRGLAALLLLSIPLLMSGCQGVSNPTTGSAGQLAVSPSTLAIGDAVVGTSGSASGELTASGGSVTVSASNSSNSAFSVSGVSLPLTLQAGQSTTFSVNFTPQIAGAASATLTFTSNAQPTTTTASASGTGTAAPTHSVNLSWNASTSPNISGYNVYRAVYTNSCGSFSKINPLLNTGILYTDSNVTDSTSYCYAATAVDTSNAESGYSNILSNVQIPAP